MLGIGSDTEDGAVVGTLTIYDASNPDDPRVAQRVTRPSSFVASWDPHAFLLWNATRQAVLPLDSGSHPAFEVYRVAPQDGLALQGSIVHSHAPDSFHARCRAAMIDGTIYTVSIAGVLASDTQTLIDRAWASFPEG